MIGGRFAQFTGLMALVLTIGAVSIASTPSRAQSEQTYLALGDSIAAGLSSSLPAERGYPAILQDLMQTHRLNTNAPGAVQLVNLAEPGETTRSFVENGQLEAALEQIEDDGDSLRTITLTLGGNDMLSLWDLPSADREAGLEEFQDLFEQAVGDLATAVEGLDTDVVVTTYYDLTEGDTGVEGSDAWWLARFNEVIVEVANDAGLAVVDLEGLFRGRISSLTWFPADVHPNNAGHREIARAVWQQLAYDQDAPAVEITRPENGEARSRVPTVHATVDDDVGVETVELYVNEEFVKELILGPDGERWIAFWDGRNYAEAEVEIAVVARDLAGNESNDSVSVTLPAR